MFWPEDAHLIKRHPERALGGGCINEECCGTRRDIVTDHHAGTDVCTLCGIVQSTHSAIVYEEDKRTFGQDKDGEKGADNRRTSAVMDRDLSDLSKPLPGKRLVKAPLAYSAPTVEAVAAVAAASPPLPTAGALDDTSSVSSVSTEESDDDESDGEGDPNVDRVRWKLKMPVMQWGTTRQSQIREGLFVMKQNGFISHDQTVQAQGEADACLRVVVHDEPTWRSHHMASSAYWTCALTMKMKEREWREWIIRGKNAEAVDEARAKWTMESMHAVLLGDKSKGFRSHGEGGGEYLTNVGSNVGRKYGFGLAVYGSKVKRRKLDVRKLGTKEMQLKKMASLNAVMIEANVPPMPGGISRLEQPGRHLYAATNTAREKAENKVVDKFNKYSQSDRKSDFLKSRGLFIGTRPHKQPVQEFVPMGQQDVDIIPGIEDMYTHKERQAWTQQQNSKRVQRAPSPSENLEPLDQAQIPSDGEEDPEQQKDNFLDATLGLVPKKLSFPKPAEPESSQSTVVADSEPEPAEPAEDPAIAMQRQQADALAAFQAQQADALAAFQTQQSDAAAARPEHSSSVATSELEESSSDDDSDSDDDFSEDDEYGEPIVETGPRREGDDTASEPPDADEPNSDDEFFTANRTEVADQSTQAVAVAAGASKPDLPAAVVARMKRVKKAKWKQQNDVELTKSDLADLDWWSRVDVQKLQEDGEVVAIRRKKEVTWEQRAKRMREHRDKTANRDRRRAERDLRHELKRQKEDEKKGVKEDRRLARIAEDQAKLDRRAARDGLNLTRANDKLTGAINKQRKTAQQRIEKKRAKIIAKLAMAQKYNRIVAVAVEGMPDELRLKIRMPVKPLPKPRRELPCAGTYAQFYANNRLTLQDGSTPVPLPVPYARPGEDGVRVELKTRPGAREGTRAHKRKAEEADKEAVEKQPRAE